MTNIEYTLTATADCCGFKGTLAALKLHSCAIEEFGGQCEDYPCCGHTDGGGCQTTPEMTSAYYTDGPGRVHLLCDHEQGLFECEDEEEPDEEEDDDTSDEVAFAGSEY